MQAIEELEDRLEYEFQRRELLEQAVTHSSWANEEGLGPLASNERLEFLGDAVLGFCVSDFLCGARPNLNEGELSKLKGFLVSAENLVDHAERLELGDCLLLGRGEEKTGGRKKRALLVNAFEAVLGAIYLDGGIDAARRTILSIFKQQLDRVVSDLGQISNFKSELQESLQARGVEAARYRLVEAAGPDHERLFTVEVLIEGQPVSQGRGWTKKAAEQSAARHAIANLKRVPSGRG